MSTQYADLRETLAALEHERWSLWQSYVFSRCDRREDGGATIPADLVERWQRQSETPYDQLNEREKQSDREQVDRYWPLIEEYVANQAAIGHGDPPAEHSCPHPPDVRPGPVPVRPDWECGQCGRIWRLAAYPFGGGTWMEICGPTGPFEPGPARIRWTDAEMNAYLAARQREYDGTRSQTHDD